MADLIGAGDMNDATDADRARTAPALQTAAADPRARMPWLPGDARNSKLTAAGQYWDAVRVPRAEGEQVVKILGEHNGAIIADGTAMYWLIVPGAGASWDIPLGRNVYICGRSTWVGVPGLQCRGIPHWRISPTDVHDWLTSAGLLYRALVDVLRDGDT